MRASYGVLIWNRGVQRCKHVQRRGQCMVVAGITVVVVAIGGFGGLVGSDDVMNRLDNV